MAALTDNLQQHSLLIARVFFLPQVTKEAEHAPAGYYRGNATSGEEGRSAGATSLSPFVVYSTTVKSRSSKAAVRLHGVLCYQVDNAIQLDLENQIQRINQLKTTFRADGYGRVRSSPQRRFEVVHRHLPRLNYAERLPHADAYQ